VTIHLVPVAGGERRGEDWSEVSGQGGFFRKVYARTWRVRQQVIREIRRLSYTRAGESRQSRFWKGKLRRRLPKATFPETADRRTGSSRGMKFKRSQAAENNVFLPENRITCFQRRVAGTKQKMCGRRREGVAGGRKMKRIRRSSNQSRRSPPAENAKLPSKGHKGESRTRDDPETPR